MLKLSVSDRIELRAFVEEDAIDVFELVKANIEHLQPFLHWATDDYSLESAKDFVRRAQKDFEENIRQGFGIFFDKKLVGTIGFVKFNWTSRRTEIGYWIAKEFEGRGIITKSCEAIINYAFDELKFNRIEIRCAVENKRSAAVPERLGFKLEGVLRQAEWRHTRFYDTAIYGILAEEWRK